MLVRWRDSDIAQTSRWVPIWTAKLSLKVDPETDLYFGNKCLVYNLYTLRLMEFGSVKGFAERYGKKHGMRMKELL